MLRTDRRTRGRGARGGASPGRGGPSPGHRRRVKRKIVDLVQNPWSKWDTVEPIVYKFDGKHGELRKGGSRRGEVPLTPGNNPPL